MKAAIFQPPYPKDKSAAAALDCIRWMEDRLDALRGQDIDIIVLPEYCNCPGIDDVSVFRDFIDNEGKSFTDNLMKLSLDLNCLIASCEARKENKILTNRAIIYSKGQSIYKYDKLHLTDAEIEMGFLPGAQLGTFDYDGKTFGFATCFDIYFPEYTAALGAKGIDIMICQSYQRSEAHKRIEAISKTRAMDSGAWMLRSSYSMGQNSTKGGKSMLIDPAGEIRLDAESSPCVLIGDFNPMEKYSKPASFGRASVFHKDLIEKKRRNCFYRSHVEQEIKYRNFPFPRLCAHRGISLAMPENSIPAFAAALASGAHEIEFDLWLSSDGVPVICHDPDLMRVAGVNKIVTETSWDEISKIDFGAFKNEEWRGVRIPRFEDVLDIADGSFGMNIHIKDPGKDGVLVKMVGEMIRARGLLNCAYIGGGEEVLEAAFALIPDVSRACLANQNDPDKLMEAAFKYECARIQFFPSFTEKHARQAAEAGIIRNLFYSDDYNEAMKYVSKGIDVILTNKTHLLTGKGFNSTLIHDYKFSKFPEI